MNHDDIPTWPHVTAIAREDGGEVTINGTSYPVTGNGIDTVRQKIVATVAAETASQLGRPVRVLASDPGGEWPIIVHPDGTPEPDTSTTSQASAGRRARRHQDAPAPSPAAQAQTSPQPEAPMPTNTHPASPPAPDTAPTGNSKPIADRAAAEPHTEYSPTTAAATGQDRPMTRREALQRSFLSDTRDDAPPEQGFRGLLARLGIKVQPSPAEVAKRADERAVSQHWPGPRTVAIVNGKGGAGKTPATILLAALLARYGGSGVLAWDNNPTRGTLGWRTEQGPHENTVLDLLPRTDTLLAPDARAAELAQYVHHQTADKYDVLRSYPEVLATDQRITAHDFDVLHGLAAKYYRAILLDSGNDESAEPWLRMVDHSDQLVVATTTREEHAESGRLLLEELSRRDEHSARLADRAVVIVSQASTNEPGPATLTQAFSQMAREAVAIPYDPEMSTRWLRYDALASETQRAWLRAAAAVARGL